MKTKQEQIEEMAKYVCNACEMGHGFDGCSYGGREHYKRCSITQKTAEKLYNAGYRKIDEFEKCRKCPAWSGTDCTRNPYTEGCLDDKVNLKNEIKRLEKENKQLKTECALLDDELRIARQDTIDVLNELKTKAFDKDAFNGWAGSTFVVLVRDIDKMIEELTKCQK